MCPIRITKLHQQVFDSIQLKGHTTPQKLAELLQEEAERIEKICTELNDLGYIQTRTSDNRGIILVLKSKDGIGANLHLRWHQKLFHFNNHNAFYSLFLTIIGLIIAVVALF